MPGRSTAANPPWCGPLPRERVMTTDRRKFLAKAGVAMAAVAATSLVDAPDVIAQPKVQWRMPTTWTPANDTLQGAALLLAKIVEETSGGRFRIEVFPSGQIVQPFECFDAASKGTIEAFMGSGQDRKSTRLNSSHLGI